MAYRLIEKTKGISSHRIFETKAEAEMTQKKIEDAYKDLKKFEPKLYKERLGKGKVKLKIEKV